MSSGLGDIGGGRASPGHLLDAAAKLAPVLRENAERAEWASRLTEESTAALRGAGLFRLGVPRAYRGHEASLATCLEIAAELARACPSSSWIVAISYGAQHIAASFGADVRRELWGNSPDIPLCGSFNGVGLTATRVDGGQLVSGRWSWASGSYQARWAALGIPVVNDSGEVIDQAMAIVPMDDLAIRDTWDMAGMRGTGSHTLIGERFFVPHHRMRPFASLIAGPTGPIEPLYRIPVGSLALTLAGPMLGMARAVFDQTMEVITSGKPMAGSTYSHLADSPSIQANLADAANLIDSAQLHLFRSADYLDRAAAGQTPLEPTARARVRMDIGHATACLRQAVHLLLNVAGGSAFASVNPIQRFWRDLETAARHPSLGTELSREIYGRALVGNQEQVSFLI
jgi:alkylation response protein AidB-like acyl-CoA dehydrogenase